MSTWVLLRGLTREARHWGEFPALFRRALPDASVVAVDLPGCGTHHGRTSPARIEGIVECVRGELGAKAQAGPFHVLALSLGAMVAVEWAAKHPGEVAACVLVNTSLRPLNAFHERLRPRHYPLLLRLALLEIEPHARESAILSLTSANGDPGGRIVEAWSSYRREAPISRANALRQLLAAARYSAPEAPPPVPVLLLASARDQLVSPNCSRTLARRWGVPLAMHPSAGHDLPLDDGPWVAAEIRRWLRS